MLLNFIWHCVNIFVLKDVCVKAWRVISVLTIWFKLCWIMLNKYNYCSLKPVGSKLVTPPTAKLNFDAHFVNDTLNWKKIYSLPYCVALDTKTRKFQYKLLNRCLVTNTFLCRIGIIPSPACSLCGESEEYLKYLFLSCHYTKNFWSEVIKWLVDHKVKIENLSDKDFQSWPYDQQAIL